MGIDLHRVGDGLELDCSFGHYKTEGSLLHWAYECGAFAPQAFKSDSELYAKQDVISIEIASEMGLNLETLKYDSPEHRHFLKFFAQKSHVLFRVPGDSRPSISTFAGSTGYFISPRETKEMLKYLPKTHEKYQHFIDFLKKCVKSGFTVD